MKDSIKFAQSIDANLKIISDNILDDNFMDYIGYWNEKYYRKGFCDGIQLISECLEK